MPPHKESTFLSRIETSLHKSVLCILSNISKKEPGIGISKSMEKFNMCYIWVSAKVGMRVITNKLFPACPTLVAHCSHSSQ
jgi:hypothetical protein